MNKILIESTQYKIKYNNKIPNYIIPVDKQLNENKNTFRKNKNSNLNIITNLNTIDRLNNKNIEKFNKDLNSEFIKNNDINGKNIIYDTSENIENILVNIIYLIPYFLFLSLFFYYSD